MIWAWVIFFLAIVLAVACFLELLVKHLPARVLFLLLPTAATMLALGFSW